MKINLMILAIFAVSCSSLNKEQNQSYKICLDQAKVMMENNSLSQNQEYCKNEVRKGQQ